MPALRPAIKAIVAGCVRPISISQIPPGRARSQNPENTIENAAITFVDWKKRLNHSTLEASEVVARDAARFGSLNHTSAIDYRTSDRLVYLLIPTSPLCVLSRHFEYFG